MALYLGCLAFGGLFLGASLLGGHDGHGGHDGGGHDGGGHDGDHAGATHDAPAQHGPWLPFLSVRFWTFALAFFGLTGAALTAAGAAVAAVVPAVAGAVGVGAGYGASRLLGGLARRPVGLLAAGASHVGREGVLLLPVGPGQRGKIRLTIGGVSTDFVAETEAQDTLPAGATVIVVGLRDNVALIERNLLPPLDDKERS
jgi:membrane protein implicated in regulation of membrane protease activity